jgi:hypothetical protein
MLIIITKIADILNGNIGNYQLFLISGLIIFPWPKNPVLQVGDAEAVQSADWT